MFKNTEVKELRAEVAELKASLKKLNDSVYVLTTRYNDTFDVFAAELGLKAQEELLFDSYYGSRTVVSSPRKVARTTPATPPPEIVRVKPAWRGRQRP